MKKITIILLLAIGLISCTKQSFNDPIQLQFKSGSLERTYDKAFFSEEPFCGQKLVTIWAKGAANSEEFMLNIVADSISVGTYEAGINFFTTTFSRISTQCTVNITEFSGKIVGHFTGTMDDNTSLSGTFNIQ